MKALVIMHCASEGPGTLGDFLADQGVALEFARLHDGDRLPDPAGYSAVVSMGGPMNVYDEAEHPFLREETEFLREVVAEGVPALGVCLGAQMIAKAAGARVGRSPRPEVGWGRVELTAAGRREPLFSGMSPVQDVLQWHGDMFEVPVGSEVLAHSADCPHQAFRVNNALGLQYHLEVDEKILTDWFAGRDDFAAIIARYRELSPALRREAGALYRNFLALITSK